MRTVKISLAVLAVLCIFGTCRKEDMKPPCLGIVTASQLSCRTEPRLDAPVKKMFSFGTPVSLVERSEGRTEQDGRSGYWYREETTKGWLFGGYLLTTVMDEEKLARFDMERIRCNVICGGLSCFAEFNPVLVGDFYIATMYLNDYPQDNEPAYAIIIGRYERTDDSITFMNPHIMAGYDDRAQYIEDIMSKNFDARGWLTMDFQRKYYRSSDSEGTFYFYGRDNIDRGRLRARCSDKSVSEEIWYDIYTLEKATLPELQHMFPLIEMKGNRYIVR